MSDNSLKLKEIIKNIGNVGALSSDELIQISYNLFKNIKFCNCLKLKKSKSKENNLHKHCQKFNYHDYEHAPLCKCCQTQMLKYYLGRCMEKLAIENKLPEFFNRKLSAAKIRDRTYGLKRNKSVLQFRIQRHLYAWTEYREEITVEEIYEFDFKMLVLKKIERFL
jgi:hypothetical protein